MKNYIGIILYGKCKKKTAQVDPYRPQTDRGREGETDTEKKTDRDRHKKADRDRQKRQIEKKNRNR